MTDAPIPQPLVDRIMHCVAAFSDLDTTDEEWTVSEAEQFALRALLKCGSALTHTLLVETIEAYIKAHETSDISERYYRYTEMKDALRRVRFERKRAEQASTARIDRVPTLPVNQAASDELDAALQEQHDAAPKQVLVPASSPAAQQQSAAPVVERVIEKPACPICSGKGYTETASSLSSGRTAEDLIPCPVCNGTGLTESDPPFTQDQLDRIAATPMHCTAEQYAAMAEKLAPFFNGPASWCPTCGKPLPVHGPYFMPCSTCPSEPRHILVIEELAAAIANRDLPPGENRYAQWSDAERALYRDMARAVLNHLSPLRAAWVEAFGLVVCRNGSKTDQAKVSRFWVLMNQLTGLTRPEGPAP